MSDPIPLTRRVAQLCACSYEEAARVIADGGVTVDGRLVTDPDRPVRDEQVEVAPAAHPDAIEPATLLWHKPAGVACSAMPPIEPAGRWSEDPSRVQMLPRHYRNLTLLMPIEPDASGLVVLSQDGRVWRRLTEDLVEIEQEWIVEVSGKSNPYTLGAFNRGIVYNGRPLPPCKVSWQNEVRLRFAITNVQPGQLHHMCAHAGLGVVSLRRLRIGRIALAKMPVGNWRALPPGERF
jgi:23S rRNA pseudouridine2604 synthase